MGRRDVGFPSPVPPDIVAFETPSHEVEANHHGNKYADNRSSN